MKSRSPNWTAKQRAVCKLIAYGVGDKAIAETLGITVWGVQRRVDGIYRKIGPPRSRPRLIAVFMRLYPNDVVQDAVQFSARADSRT